MRLVPNANREMRCRDFCARSSSTLLASAHVPLAVTMSVRKGTKPDRKPNAGTTFVLLVQASERLA